MLPLLPLTLLSISFFSLAAAQDRQFIITNRCPESIPLYIGGVPQGNLSANGGSVSKTLPGSAGFFYTSANGGNADGTRTTRAGFRGDEDYYFIVIDPEYFNTGLAITPLNHAPYNGFCATAACTTGTCTTAYQCPPRVLPDPGETAPTPPLYACPSDPDEGYLIEFCPGGSFPTPPQPQPTTVTLHPNGNTAKCADVRGAVFADGTPVQIYDCNGTPAQKWVINRGPTKVQLADTDFCLDAGSTPGNGVGAKIWTCYDSLPAQAWYYTDDNRIALEGQGLCLDLTNGVLTNSNQLQTWQCTDNNNNQLWTT